MPIKVFYRSEQTALNTNLASPSPGKPALVVDRWRQLQSIEIVGCEPLSRADLALAHDRDYVDDVLDLRVSNGFGTKDALIADTLPFTSGSFFAAARHAYLGKVNAASPTSGFHHAGYAYGGCFCTFNGLMVAAQKMRAEFPHLQVGILDLDRHYGDGTDDIIEHLGLDYITHYTFGGERVNPENSDEWLAGLPEILARFASCDVVFYQAGADPHIDDPLGRVLTTSQLFARDQTVFKTLHAAGVPVAWNLAGGYQKPISKVLDLHDNTMRACIGVC